MRRTFLCGLVLVVLAAACAQAPPERGALPPLPDAFEFPPTSTTLVPDDGTCVVTPSNGVRIEEVQDGYEAAEVLAVGDRIVAVGDDPVINQSTLRAALADVAPGSRLDISYVRDGTSETTPVTLGAAPDNPDRGMIGIIVRNSFDVVATSELSHGAPGPGQLLVAFDEALFGLDVATGVWVGVDLPVPESPIVQVGEDFIAVSEDRTGLISLADGELFQLDRDDVLVVAPLGLIDGGLVYSVVRLDEEGTVTASIVQSTDLATGVTKWSHQLPIRDTTYPIPVSGYPDPSGRYIAVTHRHVAGQVHTIYTSEGTPVLGWGSDTAEFAADGAALAGWLDEERLVAIALGADDDVVAAIIRPHVPDAELEIFPLGTSDLISAYAIEGTSKVLVASSTQTTLFDLEDDTFDVLTRNCGVVVLGRTV